MSKQHSQHAGARQGAGASHAPGPRSAPAGKKAAPSTQDSRGVVVRIVPTGIPEETVAIDKITMEDDYAISWLSKYAGDPSTQYRGARPRGLYRQLDRELERHGRTIDHPSNPLGKLILVTNTEHSVALLQWRAREVLGADFPVAVMLMP